MPSLKPPPLREVQFGELDASEEAIDDPELLISGFYDYREAAYSIAATQTWLLLGPKGAGKSAVMEHLRLTWEGRSDRFFLGWNLQDFPVADVTRMKTGEFSAASRAQTAWRFLLLLRVVESLSKDQGIRGVPAFDKMVQALRKSGALADDWKAKVVRWSKSSATVKLPFLELGIEVTHDEVGTIEAAGILEAVLKKVSTESQHLVFLDGLDQFFFDVEQEWQSLAGLTHAIASVNRMFRASQQRISIVAAIRSDIFDVLPSPESNKLKPHAVQLDWSALGIGAGNQLWQVVGAKAAVSRPAARDLISTYLGSPVKIGPHTSIAEYFLDNTRLLPRDLIALLNILKVVHPGSGPVTQSEAIEAVTRYCDEYFQGEIFNNLAGVLRDDGGRKLAEFRDALRVVPTRLFNFDDVQSELTGSLAPSETKTLLKQMFEVGAIGVRNSSGAGPEYTDFVYRKVTRAGFTTRHGFLLHNALVRAWNRPWR